MMEIFYDAVNLCLICWYMDLLKTWMFDGLSNDSPIYHLRFFSGHSFLDKNVKIELL